MLKGLFKFTKIQAELLTRHIHCWPPCEHSVFTESFALFFLWFFKSFSRPPQTPAPVLAHFFRDVKCFHFSQTYESHQKLLLTTSLLVKDAQWTQSFRTGPFYLTTSIKLNY